MEHILTSHIMKHANDHKISYGLQHGFRAGTSRETHDQKRDMTSSVT